MVTTQTLPTRLFLFSSTFAPIYAVIAALTTPQIALVLLAGVVGMFSIFLSRYRLPLTLVLLYIATSSSTEISSSDVLGGSYVSAHYVRLAIIVCASMIIANRTIPALSNLFAYGGSIAFFFIYLVFCISSSVWSQAPMVTLAKSLELMTAFLVILCCLNEQPVRQIFESFEGLFQFSVAVIVFSLEITFLGYLISPETNSEYSLLADKYFIVGTDLSLSSNGVSRYGAIISILTLAQLIKRRTERNYNNFILILLFILGVCAQVMAVGRTGIASFIVSAFILLLYRPRLFAAVLLPIFSIFIGVYRDEIGDFLLRGQDSYDVVGLSGRVGWWKFAIEGMSDHPLIGLGFGVGNRVIFQRHGVSYTSGLHNGFLEVLTGVGIIGFLIWIVPFGSWLLSAIRSLVGGINREINILVVPLLLSTVVSQGAGGWMSVEYGLFLIMLFLGSKSMRPIWRPSRAVATVAAAEPNWTVTGGKVSPSAASVNRSPAND